MKKIINLLLALTLLIGISSCSTVPAGNVGVKVYLLGDSKGVQSEQLGVGRYWIGFNEQLFTYPTFTQTYTYTESSEEGSHTNESISFQTIESLTIHTDVAVSYHIDPNDVVKVFQKYREGVKEITAGPLRNEVRSTMNDIASTYTVDDILGKGKVPFMDSVKRRVIKDMGKVGVTVEDVYLVGKLSPPENIEAAIRAKIQSQQEAFKAQNDIATARYKATRDSVEAAGQSKAQNELKAALTPELLQKMWIDKWDGHLSNTSVNSGNVMLPLGLKQ
jgi:regulator of protease activity HflC (stomatin/prohibitin superfamily)